MMYFAYGSNLNQQRMIERGVIFTEMRPAKLYDYELRFNKVSKQGAVANVIYKKDSIVEGILYRVQSLDLLDKYEGVKSGHYNRVLLNVDGVLANVYICENKQFLQEGLKPKQEYLNHLLEGKNYMSEEYFEKLKMII